MRVNRFFVNKPLGEETFTITDTGALHQILKVFRLKEGDSVAFFNGSSFHDYEYSLRTLHKDKIDFTLVSKSPQHDAPPQTVLYLSLIKKDLFELAVLKATELGVSHIVPLVTQRTNKHFLHKERLYTILKEGSEQCGRNTLPVLCDPIVFDDISMSLKDFSIQSGSAFSLSLLGAPAAPLVGTRESSEALAFFVGPEGGWAIEEEAFFENNKIHAINVSPFVLRAETAAIICTYLSFLFRK